MEVVVAVLLVGLVLGNLLTVLDGSTEAMSARAAHVQADVQARRVIERIATALIGSSEETLQVPIDRPGSVPELDYLVNFGLGDDLDGDGRGDPVWSEPQRITWSGEAGGEVIWFENPGGENQRRAVWARAVSEFGAGEIPNGRDDNGDGLIDETGLAFAKEGRSVRISLSMRAPDGAGGVVDRRLETVVTCRN